MEFQTPMTGASMKKSFVHMKERGLDNESVGGPFKETPPPPFIKKVHVWLFFRTQ